MLGSIYAMIGVALTLSIGVLKFLNFSIPGLFMIGGMSTWVFIRHGMPWPLAGFPRWGDLAFAAIRGETIEPLFDEPRDKPWLSH